MLISSSRLIFQRLVQSLSGLGRAGEEETTAILSAADGLNQLRSWADAIIGYNKVLSRRPDLAAVWVQKGHCEKELGLVVEAERSYRSAIAAEEMHWDAHLHLAHLLKTRGDLVDAFGHLRLVWQATRADNVELDLSDLIGTSNALDDVFRVMENCFDPVWYLQRYRDVQTSGLDPSIHYLLHGWREGRQPTREFDPAFYVDQFGHLMPPGVVPFVHFQTSGKGMGLRGSRLTSMPWFEPKAPSALDWDRVAAAPMQPSVRACVIIPVYRGFDETLACIFHALRARGSASYGVLVVNDCSPDHRLQTEIEGLAGRGLFTYCRNSVNLGFVKTVNSVLRGPAAGYDVVLLNSDAFVFPGWFERMVAHADRSGDVATVTPLSNNATICSYPIIGEDNDRSIELSPHDLDQLVAQELAGRSIEALTGVGFCMFMSRRAIAEVGCFDESTFGRGYGEENDFCMRALAAGYRNLIAHDVFAYHLGSVSFAESKVVNMRAGEAALEKRYPSYNMRIGLFMKADPGRILRRKIDVARLRKSFQRGVVLVTHQWGGGIEKYVRGEINELRRCGRAYVILRLHDLHFVTVETDGLDGLYVPNLIRIDLRFEGQVVRDLLEALDLSEVVVNSFAGLDWSCHKRLMEIIREASIVYRFVVHDFSCISHNLNLIRPDGLEGQLTTWGDIEAASAMQNSEFPDVCSPAERMSSYRSFLSGAASIYSPSCAAKEIVDRFYPGLRITVVPHREPLTGTQRIIPNDDGGEVRVAVVGGISVAKGYLQLLELASDAAARGLSLRYFLVGYSVDDNKLRAAGVGVTGRYRDDNAAIEALRQIRPNLVLFPGVCPETYCYALSIAITIGVKPVVFDVGAQAERVREWGWGTVLNLDLAVAPAEVNNILLRHSCSDGERS